MVKVVSGLTEILFIISKFRFEEVIRRIPDQVWFKYYFKNDLKREWQSKGKEKEVSFPVIGTTKSPSVISRWQEALLK